MTNHSIAALGTAKLTEESHFWPPAFTA